MAKKHTYEEIKDIVASEDSGRKSYTQLKEEVAEERLNEEASAVDEKYINKFFSDSDTYFSQSQEDLNGMTWAGATSAASRARRSSISSELDYRSNVITRFLDTNRDRFDEDTVQNVYSALEGYRTDSDSLAALFDEYETYYSQWDTEDAYNSYLMYQEQLEKEREEREALLGFDTEAGKAELAELKKKRGERELLEVQLRMVQDGYGTVDELTDLQKRLAEYDGLDPIISEKEKYLWNAENAQKYGAVAENADFEKNSGYISTKSDRFLDESDSMYGMGYEDLAYEYINNQNGIRPEIEKNARLHSLYSGETMTDFREKHYDQMREEEISIYNYLYHVEGKKAAREYLDYLQYALDERAMAEYASGVAEFADEHPVISSISSVFDTLGSGVGALDVLFQNISHNIKEMVTGEYAGPVNYNRNSMQMSVSASTIRGTVAQKIADECGVIRIDEDEHPILSRIFNGKGLADVYQLGMSMLDSTAVAGLELLGIPGGTVLLGGSAATQAVLEAAANGATDEQALFMGLLNGAAEILFEKYELESILENASDGFLKATLKSMLSEGAGEGATTIANILSDIIVMADKSGWQTGIDKYITEGKSPDEAKRMAFWDAVIQVGWDAAGGAVMGGVMGGTFSAADYAYNLAQYHGLDADTKRATVSEALEIDPGNAYAQKMQARLDEGKKLSGRQVYNLIQQNEAVLHSNSVSETTAAAAERLTQLGETGDIPAISEALAKQADGQRLSRRESALIEKSEYGRSVAEELSQGSIPISEYYDRMKQRSVMEGLGLGEYIEILEEAQQEEAAGELEAEPASPEVGVAESNGGTAIAKAPTAIQEAAKKYNAQAGAFAASYLPEQDVGKYDAGFEQVYNYAYSGTMNKDGVKRMKSLYPDSALAYLTEDQIEFAYAAGKTAAQTALGQGADFQEGKYGAEEVRLRQGTQWADGENSGGQVRGMEAGAGGVQVREEAAPGGSGAGSQAAKDAQGRVSAKEIGIADGTDRQTVRAYSGKATRDIRDAKEIARKYGKKILLFQDGNLEINDKIVGAFDAIAYIQGDTVYVRADHPQFSAAQLATHEVSHQRIADGEIDAKRVYDRMVKTYGEEYVDYVLEEYAKAHIMSGMDAQEIFEEILCDSEADMNAFAPETAPLVQHFLEDVKQTADTDAQTRSARAPPGEVEGKASRGKYWKPNLTKAEWSLLDHTMELEIGTSDKYIDKGTKWLYADSKGVKVFAIYGIGDGTVPTPLYAVGWEKASSDYTKLTDFMEGKYNGIDETRINFGRWVKIVSDEQRQSGFSVYANGKRVSAEGNDSISGGTRAGNREGDSGSGKENRGKVNGKASREITGKASREMPTYAEVEGKASIALNAYDYSVPFEQQVDDWIHGKIPARDSLVVGATPEVFRKIGFNALPMTINQTHVDYAVNGTKDADHFLGAAQLKTLPQKLDEPVAIIASKTQTNTSVVALLEMQQNGKTVVVPVVIDGMARQNGIRIDSNAITSVFGKGNAVTDLLKTAFSMESSGGIGVYYLDKRKTTRLLQGSGLQLPGGLQRSSGLIHSIRENGSPVKPKMNSVTESLQFKRWFGDWQKNPQKASKVVNPDGTPKVMYHGSPAENGDFTVFDRSKAVKKGGLGFKAKGDGNYFSANPKGIERYAKNGGKVYSCYLNLRNPYESSGGILDQISHDFGVELSSNSDVKPFLEQHGYDGIVVRDNSGEITLAVAYEANQIKSATENVGTFDRSNPDIRYSREMPTNAELKRENAALRERLEYWRGQVKQTTRKTVRLADVDKVATAILEDYQSEANFGSIRNTMKELADSMIDPKADRFHMDSVTPEDGVEAALWERARERAVEIAGQIVEKSQTITNSEELETFKSIKQYLRGTRISLTETADIADWGDFRKRNFGRLLLSKDGVPMDVVWMELQDTYGKGFFPESITHPADQLLHLETLLNAMEPQYANPFKGAIPQSVEICANEIMDRLFSDAVRQTAPTFADRQARRMAELDASVQASRQRIRELQTQQKTIRREFRQRQKDAAQARKESAAVSKYRGRVEKNVKFLTDTLARPTDQAHVPAELQKPIGDFLRSLDFSSRKKLGGNGDTIRDVAYTRALNEMRSAIEAQRTAISGAKNGVYRLDVPAEFLEIIDAHIKTIHSATEGLDLTTNRVYEMSGAELKDLDFILNTVCKAIRDIDKLHIAGAKARVSDLGMGTVTEMGGRKAVKSETGPKTVWSYLTPSCAFERMGKSAVQVLDGLKQGQTKLARTVKDVLDFAEKTYTGREVKAWEQEVKTIELDSGETVRMTPAQIMSFYCLSRREHAMGHLQGGGIRVSTIGEGKRADVQKGTFVLSIEDINRINGLLTPRQLEVAGKLQSYMQETGGRLGNEISMARWDYMALTEEHYFPIQTDGNSHDAQNPGQEKANLWGLVNMSFTKRLTENANNAIVIGSIFDVFANHMSQMAEYNAFALPLVDAMRWYNYRNTEQLGNGNIRTYSVQESINDTLGTAAGAYFIDLMTDINSSQKAGRHENALGKLMSKFKVASVAWNLRVAIQQPTAILRASLMIEGRYLAKGSLRIGTKALQEEMRKYSGIALWKSLGYYELNVSRSVTEQIKGSSSLVDKANEWGMWLPGKMDDITWARIWAACKAQVSAQQHLTGEPLMEATAKLFDDVVYHTQVADSVLTRSSLMRSKSQTMKELTSFMAEPTVSVNILMEAFQNYEGGRTTWETAKRAMMIGFKGYILSSVANALVTSLMDAWRDDDDYEEFWEKYRQALFGEKGFWDGNLFGELNPLEKIVFIRDALSLLQGYDSTNSYMQVVKTAIDAVESIQNLEQGKENTTVYGVLYKCLKTVGYATGTAPANLAREAASVWNHTFGILTGKKLKTYDPGDKAQIKDAFENGFLDEDEAIRALVENTSVEDQNDAYFIVRGWAAGAAGEDYNRYASVYDAVRSGQSIDSAMGELLDHGYTEKDVLSNVKSKIGEWYMGTDKEPQSITKRQAASMLRRYTDMDSADITAQVNKWTCKVVTGIAYGDIQSEYLAGNITAQRAKQMYMLYGGYTDEKATEKVTKWKAEKDTGIAYEDIDDAFLGGKISEAEAQRMYAAYGGYTEEAAHEKVAVMAFVKQYPECDGISFAAMESYTAYCEPAGVSAAAFYDVWKYDSGTHADVDGNGKSISGTKKAKVMDYINSLDLTEAQKDSLYYAFGWAESKLSEAPWH